MNEKNEEINLQYLYYSYSSIELLYFMEQNNVQEKQKTKLIKCLDTLEIQNYGNYYMNALHMQSRRSRLK